MQELLADRRARRPTGPSGLQHLPGPAVWDADALRGDLRAYLVEHLGDRRRGWSSTDKPPRSCEHHELPLRIRR
jgi:hypothetical protein